MEIEFSHLLLLQVGLAMTYCWLLSVCCCNAWPAVALCCFGVSLMNNHHSGHARTQVWEDSTVIGHQVVS